MPHRNRWHNLDAPVRAQQSLAQIGLLKIQEILFIEIADVLQRLLSQQHATSLDPIDVVWRAGLNLRICVEAGLLRVEGSPRADSAGWRFAVDHDGSDCTDALVGIERAP